MKAGSSDINPQKPFSHVCLNSQCDLVTVTICSGSGLLCTMRAGPIQASRHIRINLAGVQGSPGASESLSTAFEHAGVLEQRWKYVLPTWAYWQIEDCCSAGSGSNHESIGVNRSHSTRGKSNNDIVLYWIELAQDHC